MYKFINMRLRRVNAIRQPTRGWYRAEWCEYVIHKCNLYPLIIKFSTIHGLIPNAGILFKLFSQNPYQLMNDRHNGIFSLLSLLFVSLNSNNIIVGFPALWKINLDTKVCPDLSYNGATFADYKWMILRIDFEFQLK